MENIGSSHDTEVQVACPPLCNEGLKCSFWANSDLHLLRGCGQVDFKSMLKHYWLRTQQE